MKKEKSIKGLKKGVFLPVFILSLIFCIILRFYHVLKCIEPETGFYTTTGLSVYLFFGVLSVSVLFFLIGGFISKNAIEFDENLFKKRIDLGFIAIILSISSLTELLNLAAQPGESVVMTSAVTVPLYFEALFSVLAAIYFIILAVKCFKGKSVLKPKLLALAPVGWGIAKIITLFVKKISYARISDLLLEIAFTAFAVVFFLSFAQCVSGLAVDIAKWRMIGTGLPAALIGFVLNVPKLCLAGNPCLVKDYPLNLMGLATGLFALFLVFGSRRSAYALPENDENSSVYDDTEDDGDIPQPVIEGYEATYTVETSDSEADETDEIDEIDEVDEDEDNE